MEESLPRPDFRVVARILEALWRPGSSMRPTQLQQASGMNYSQFSRYLQFLAERGLVAVTVEEDNIRWVDLTDRGKEAHQFLVVGLSRLFGRQT
ncbi:MAG: winged helix-turn-helix domain-containing protein [Thermoplasmata archaeon]